MLSLKKINNTLLNEKNKNLSKLIDKLELNPYKMKKIKEKLLKLMVMK